MNRILEDAIALAWVAASSTGSRAAKPSGHASERPAHDARAKYAREDVASSYETRRFRGLRGRTLDRRERAALLRALADGGRSGRTAIDVPCGTGRFLSTLGRAGFRPVGVDTSSAMMDRIPLAAAAAGLVRGDARHLPIRSKAVDGVICIRLMHHLERGERLAVIAELARVASGFAVVNYYDRGAFKNRVRALWARLRGRAPRSRNRVTRAEIAAEAATAGLRVAGVFPVTRFWSERLMVRVEPLARGDA